MSYYRYITGVYKSYWPELNRTLRSSSVPRHVPEPVPCRSSRASSVPASEFYSDKYFSRGTSATPFRDRALSVPRQLSYSYDTRSIVSQPPATHYSDFDYKVIDYMSRLDKEDTVKTNINQSRQQRTTARSYPSNTFSSNYNFYDSNKHSGDYLYPVRADVLGNWKHYNLSADTLNYRNNRAKSPLVTRQLNRYYEKQCNYVGDTGTDFRHYNYRRVPYFGGSDGYQFMKTNPFRGGRGF